MRKIYVAEPHVRDALEAYLKALSLIDDNETVRMVICDGRLEVVIDKAE